MKITVSKIFIVCALILSAALTFPPVAAGADVISEDSPAVDPQLEKEREIGRRTVEQISEHMELIADPVRLARLSMIADRLKPHLTREIPYEVRIIRMNSANAFCLPGGFIFFTSRMLELLRSDAEIAAIMAHEMIHVDQNHGLRMTAKASRINLAALAVIVLSGGATAPAVLAQVAQVAITSGYSIEFEKEADSLGLEALIAAGYSPTAMVTVMEKFMHEEMKQPVHEYGIAMDHPESAERVTALSAKMRDLGIRLERKRPLNLLATAISAQDGSLALLVDGVPVWTGPPTPETRLALENAREILDRDFQMELAPYDLHLEGGSLRLKNSILGRAPLPTGMSSLPDFRENLINALARAQKQHPAAKYFR